MPTYGFHTEWLTIGRHRVLLDCRAGFPDDHLRIIATVSAITCDTHSDGRARLIRLLADERAGICTIDIASDDAIDSEIEAVLTSVLGGMLNHNRYTVRVLIVPHSSDSQADTFDRTEYLSIAVGVAGDRTHLDDETYRATLSPPR